MKQIITTLLALPLSISLSAQTVPSAVLQAQMQREEKTFLQNMKPGLQHTQMLAIRAAMAGDSTALTSIRRSRNIPPQIPDDITAQYLSPRMCLFKPTEGMDGKRPVLLYLHGGGWCFGSINSCARFCMAVAREARCCVVALDYRLAPSHPFPEPLEDCIGAYHFLQRHAAEWGGDTTRISIGGDSAGGNLAIATAMSTDGVHSLLPIYPVIQTSTSDTPSWRAYATGYGNDAELMETFNEAYAGTSADSPLTSVGLASYEMLRKLPPVLLLSAGHDILFDQGAEWAKRLTKFGHPLDYHVFPTATHLFITVPGQDTAFREAVRIVSEFLKKIKSRNEGCTSFRSTGVS